MTAAGEASAPLTLVLVRHGATAWNEGGRWQGWTDNPLGPAGQQQARTLRGELAGQGFDAAYSSDLLRARQTADLALPGQSIILDARLRELHLGDYEGLTLTQMVAHDAFASWQRDPWAHPVPGGESLENVAARMQSWLAEVPAGRVIAFSHSIAIRTLMRALLGLALVPQPGYPIPYAERVGHGRPVTLRRVGGVWSRPGR